MKKTMLSLTALCLLAAPAHANMNKPSTPIKTTSPQGHQAIKADIIDPTPSNLTINVKKLANINVNEEAPTFAVYTTPTKPRQCGDFSNLEIHYEKPTKYTRVFNLSKHRDVLKAINSYGCVVIKNIPPKN